MKYTPVIVSLCASKLNIHCVDTLKTATKLPNIQKQFMNVDQNSKLSDQKDSFEKPIVCDTHQYC